MFQAEAGGRQGRPKDGAKREEIIAAAVQLFLDNGYGATTMDAVARRANVSKLTIYSHFTDKKELFRATIQAGCENVGLPTSFLNVVDLGAEEALLKISRSILGVVLKPESIRLMRVVHAEALSNSEITQIYFEVGPSRIRAAFADVLRELEKQKKISIPDIPRAADQFFCLLKGEMLHRILILHAPLPTAEETGAHIRATVSFFLAAYSKIPTETEKL
jgi:TetR/AcrR family transcriptional repressor of mexJK operon